MIKQLSTKPTICLPHTQDLKARREEKEIVDLVASQSMPYYQGGFSTALEKLSGDKAINQNLLLLLFHGFG